MAPSASKNGREIEPEGLQSWKTGMGGAFQDILLNNQLYIGQRLDAIENKQNEIIGILKSILDMQSPIGATRSERSISTTNQQNAPQEQLSGVDMDLKRYLISLSASWYLNEGGQMIMTRSGSTPQLTREWMDEMKSLLTQEQLAVINKLDSPEQEALYLEVSAIVQKKTEEPFFVSRNPISSGATPQRRIKFDNEEARLSRKRANIEFRDDDEPVVKQEPEADTSAKRKRTARPYRETTTCVVHDSEASDEEEDGENHVHSIKQEIGEVTDHEESD